MKVNMKISYPATAVTNDTSTTESLDYTSTMFQRITGEKVRNVYLRSFSPASLFRNNQDRSREADQFNELQELFRPVSSAFRNIQIDYMNLTPEMLEALDST